MYELVYDRRIERDLRSVPPPQRRVILERAASLATEPRRSQVEKLAGVDGYRLRVGDYRVLFTIDDRAKQVVVYRVKHRRDVYRSL